MKERVTLTIEQDLLARIDATINNETIKNRSHAVELLLRKSMRGKVPSTAVILAGGTKKIGNVIKAMTLVHGKPILQHNIELLQKFGVSKIIIAVNTDKETIKQHFGNGESSSVSIEYVEEEQPLGTAGCLRLLKDKLTEPFIMLNGDELKEVNLEKLFAAHNKYEGTITIALTTTTEPEGYGVALLDGNNILRFDEKPTDGAKSALINAGLYIMEPSAITLVPEGFSMLEQDVFPTLAREGKLFGYPFSGTWIDITDEKDLRRAEQEWKT